MIDPVSNLAGANPKETMMTKVTRYDFDNTVRPVADRVYKMAINLPQLSRTSGWMVATNRGITSLEPDTYAPGATIPVAEFKEIDGVLRVRRELYSDTVLFTKICELMGIEPYGDMRDYKFQ